VIDVVRGTSVEPPSRIRSGSWGVGGPSGGVSKKNGAGGFRLFHGRPSFTEDVGRRSDPASERRPLSNGVVPRGGTTGRPVPVVVRGEPERIGGIRSVRQRFARWAACNSSTEACSSKPEDFDVMAGAFRLPDRFHPTTQDGEGIGKIPLLQGPGRKSRAPGFRSN